MDAYTTALLLLSRRELSIAQLRTRLARKKYEVAEIDAALERLTADGSVDDRRAAVAAARLEGAVRHRGRRRVLQRLQQLGVNDQVARAAVDDVFAEIDEHALLDRALDRKLRGAEPRQLDQKQKARIVRGLVAQGFDAEQVLERLRRR